MICYLLSISKEQWLAALDELHVAKKRNWVSKTKNKWTVAYIALAIFLQAEGISAKRVSSVIAGTTKAFNVTLVGGVATTPTHAKFVHYGGTISDAMTVEAMLSSTSLVLGSDSSMKAHREYQPAVVTTSDKQHRLMGIVPMPGKLSAEDSFEYFRQSVLNPYEKLSQDLNLSTSNSSLFVKFVATITDHANDQKAWNAKFIEMIRELQADTETKKILVQLFCCVHRIQISSRDTATALYAFTNNTDFSTQKSSQKRFDDFKDPVYSFIHSVHLLLKIEVLKALWVKWIGVPLPSEKTTTIRFLTFDKNAFHIWERWSDLENFLSLLVAEQREDHRENLERLQILMRDETMQLKLWLIATKYYKIDVPYLRLSKAFPSNVDFNEALTKVLPDLKGMIENPFLFFESESQVRVTLVAYIQVFPKEYQSDSSRRPRKPTLQLQQDKVATLQRTILTVVYNAIDRNIQDFLPGGQLHGLTEEDKELLKGAACSSNHVERAVAILSRIQKNAPVASPAYLNAKTLLAYNRSFLTVPKIVQLFERFPNLLDLCKERYRQRQSRAVWDTTILGWDEKKQEKKRELEAAKEQRRLEKETARIELENEKKLTLQEIAFLKVDELRRECKKHHLFLPAPRKMDYLLRLVQLEEEEERERKLAEYSKWKKDTLCQALKEKGVKLTAPTKDDWLTALCGHIRPDDTCDCTDTYPSRDIYSYIGEIAVIILDIETDGYDQLMEIAIYDIVSKKWYKVQGTLIQVPRDKRHHKESPYRQHDLTYEFCEFYGEQFPVAWQQILGWINSLNVSKVLFLAHNGDAFDFRILRTACLHYCMGDPFANPKFLFGDTLRLCRVLRGDNQSNRLSKLVEAFEVSTTVVHRAAADVRSLAEVLQAMLAGKTNNLVQYLLDFFQPKEIDQIQLKLNLKRVEQAKRRKRRHTAPPQSRKIGLLDQPLIQTGKRTRRPSAILSSYHMTDTQEYTIKHK